METTENKNLITKRMEQIKATFHFSEKYQHTNYSQQEATVKLEVDYKEKHFSVTPPYNGDKFQFKQTSRDYKKWTAVLSCIKKAIEFGNMEIGVTDKNI